MRKNIGLFGIILGSLILSLEFYGLKIIQSLQATTGSWYTYAIDYAYDMPCSLAIVITIIVIIFSIVLCFHEGEKKE